jgi:hypothetical protein
VQDYRIYCLDGLGHISLAEWIDADSDADAVRKAEWMKEARSNARSDKAGVQLQRSTVRPSAASRSSPRLLLPASVRFPPKLAVTATAAFDPFLPFNTGG